MARRRERIGDSGTRERWRRRIEDQAASGLTQAAYCRSQGLALWRFRTWKYTRLRSEGSSPGSTALAPANTAPLFLPVEVVHGRLESVHRRPDPGVEIAVAGAVVRVALGFDGETLARVVAILGGPGC